MTYRIHIGARFRYNNPVNETQRIGIVVTDIAIVVDKNAVEVKVYFQNNLEKTTYMLSLKEMVASLSRMNATQIA